MDLDDILLPMLLSKSKKIDLDDILLPNLLSNNTTTVKKMIRKKKISK